MTEFARPLRVDRIPEAGMSLTVEANPAECSAIATRLLLPGVTKLVCRWDLRPSTRGQMVADGLLHAEVTQECVFTLEPFPASVAEAFAVRFVVAGRESQAADDPEEPDELSYDGCTIDLGEAAVEQLALALDPYPKAPGATMPEDIEAVPQTQFSALAKLRRPS